MLYNRYSVISDSICKGYYSCYTTDTQLFLTQSGKVITHVLKNTQIYLTQSGKVITHVIQ